MPSTADKYRIFLDAHQPGNPLLVPNPWDAGSARLLADQGFAALATTSVGYGWFARGLRETPGAFSRDDVLANAADIVNAVTLPVSADLQDGFGSAPQDCADTITGAIAVGLVGGSIEDTTGDRSRPIFDITAAVDRIIAAVQARADHPFVLTARAENFLYGRSDLADTITRLQAYASAGADVLYAPGLPDLDAIRTLCREVDKPVNVVMGLRGPIYTVTELADAGVARISVGGSLARVAFGALRRAAHEILHDGTFTYTDHAMPGADLAALMTVPNGTSSGR